MTLDQEKKRWEGETLNPVLKRFPGAPPRILHVLRHPAAAPADARRPRPGLHGQAGLSGRISLHARRAADHVPRPLLDHAPVRRLRHRRRVQPALPLPARAGPDRAFGGLRPAHPDRLRRRRPDCHGRGGQSGRVDLVAGGYGHALSGDPAGQGLHQHDDQRPGFGAAGDVYRRGQTPGCGTDASCAAPSRTIS